MADTHHSHGEDRTAYYLDQLFAIGVCGAIAGVTIMLWQSSLLGKMLHEKFHIWVALGGFALLAIVAIRAAAVWMSVDVSELPVQETGHAHGHAHGHDHGHGADCGHDHGHGHGGTGIQTAPGSASLPLAPTPVVAADDHGHSHSHGAPDTHGHSHSHGDGHDHGWAPWRYVVLLLPVVLYFLILSNPAFDREPVSEPRTPLDHIQNFIVIFRSVLWEAMPFIVLGALIAGMLEELLPQRVLVAILPRNRVFAVLMGGLLGLVFPMCECGIIPIMRRLLRKGLPLSCCIAYLLAGPIINGVVLISTYAAFSGMENFYEGDEASYQMGGWYMVGFRAGMGYLTAIMTALLVEWQYRKHGDSLLTPLARPSQLPLVEEDGPTQSRSLWQRLSNISETALHDFIDITVFLILGALLAATARMFLTADMIGNLGREHALLAILAMMGLAVVLCLCSEADAFVAASFVTLRPSAKLAFLVLGPMMDLKLYAMYTRIFRPRLIMTIYISVVVQVFLYCWAVHVFWDTYEWKKVLVDPKRSSAPTISEKDRDELVARLGMTLGSLATPLPGGDAPSIAFGALGYLCVPLSSKAPELRFSQLENASLTSEERGFYEGRLIRLVGRYQGYGDQLFTLQRYKINCCAADATPLKVPIRLPDKSTVKLPSRELQGNWVDVTGRVAFRKVPGSRDSYQTELIVPVSADEPLKNLIELIPPPTNPYAD